MEAQQIENVIQNNISVLLGEYGWMFLAALAVLFFKTTIESTIAGLIIFIGNDYNNDDIIILDGRPGRIVENDKLKDLKIEKPLDNFDLENCLAD